MLYDMASIWHSKQNLTGPKPRKFKCCYIMGLVLFVCFVALRPKSTDGGMVNLPNHTFPGQALIAGLVFY